MAHALRGWWISGLLVLGACQPGGLPRCEGLTMAACAALYTFSGKDGGGAGDAQDPVRLVSAATVVGGCAMHATVGEVETGLLAARCGTRGCHTAGGTFK